MTDNNELDEIVEVKVKNPLDTLPKSTMNLDACKKSFYEHKKADTMNLFLVELNKNFDNNGFSLYLAKYKYSIVCTYFRTKQQYLNSYY